MREKILIILGDSVGRFVQASGAVKDIRQHHKNAHITLLTSENMYHLAYLNPHINQVSIAPRICWWHLPRLWVFRRFLKQFNAVYDLQHDAQSHIMARLASGKGWCGTARNCQYVIRHEVLNHYPVPEALHVQLNSAGLQNLSRPDVSYLDDNKAEETLQAHNLAPHSYIVLLPGSRRSQQHRRWPHFKALAASLQSHGQNVVIAGGEDEEKLVHQLAQDLDAPLLYNLSFTALAHIFRHARCVIGNDNGPFHLASACGTEGVMLYGPDAHTQPPNLPHIDVLQHRESLHRISVETVLNILERQKKNA